MGEPHSSQDLRATGGCATGLTWADIAHNLHAKVVVPERIRIRSSNQQRLIELISRDRKCIMYDKPDEVISRNLGLGAVELHQPEGLDGIDSCFWYSQILTLGES
jgi:hypothetical protein